MSSTLQTVSRLDAVVAFDTPNVDSGVALFTIPEGAFILDLWAFCEEATNSDAGDMAVDISGLVPTFPISDLSVSPLNKSINYASLLDFAAIATEAITPTATHSGGTWTAGSIRFVAVIAEPA